MTKAICTEAELRHDYINETISTIYFGGGTPSLLPIENLNRQLKKLQELFVVEVYSEVTLEANPDDITAEKLMEWKAVGINRLSIGVQSFFEEDLQWMNRAHNAEQALRSIQLSQHAGFDNITVDLIYGAPALSNSKWKQNVETALSLNIPHLSCYALTVEPKTALEKMIDRHIVENVDANKQADQFELLMQWMEEAGYEHYEISNFAKQDFRSKHNSSYWRGATYIGLGPSAHSFNGKSRQWNIANNTLYLKSIEENIIPFEVEYLTLVQQLNEYIMTSLRTIEGLSLEHVCKNFGEEWAEKILAASVDFVYQQKMFTKGDNLILTKKGKLIADGIAAALFF